MDWGQIWTSIIITIVGGILTYLGTVLINFINSKIKDEKMKKILCNGIDVVANGVDYIYQTYVESLKGTDLWDKDAMKTANQRALDYIQSNLAPEMYAYLQDNGKDSVEWIKEQIEIAIKKSKEKKNKK